jgi:hypothetical protein
MGEAIWKYKTPIGTGILRAAGRVSWVVHPPRSSSRADPLAPREICVHLVNSRGQYPPGGVGEPGTPPFALALANAFFAATGKRITEVPIDTQELAG